MNNLTSNGIHKGLKPIEIAKCRCDKENEPQVPKGHGKMKRMRELEERCRMAMATKNEQNDDCSREP